MPYFFGTTGIGFNKKEIAAVDSWAVMFDPKYSGKIMMLKGHARVLHRRA